MAQTINADDGVISGSAGLKWASDGTAILSLQTKGTTALTVDGGQKVGIGTASPAVKLDVGYVDGNVALRVTRDSSNRLDFYQGGGISYIDSSPASGQIALATAGTERVRLDTSGRLGIGTTSPNVRLSLGSGTGTKLATFDSGGVLSGFGVDLSGGNYELSLFSGYNGGNGTITFGGYNTATSAFTERARIQSGGTFLVSADGVGSVSFAAFNKAGVSDSITTNLFTVTASNNAITGLLEINYAISDPGIETYVGRKVYRLFWNGISALLNAITTEAYGGVEPTFSLTASGATATIRVDFNSGAATYDITVAVSFTPVGTTSSIIAINEA